MCFIIVILLNAPPSLFNLIAVYLVFKLGNSPCFEEQRSSQPFFSMEVGDVQRNDPDVTAENLENPESSDENLNENSQNMEDPDENTFEIGSDISDRQVAPKCKDLRWDNVNPNPFPWDKVNPNPYPDINRDCLCKCVSDPEYVCDCDK